MANLLDEMNPVIMEEGRDANVIAKQIPVTLTENEKKLPMIAYGVGGGLALLGLIALIFGKSGGLIGILVGLGICFYVYKKLKDTEAYFYGLEQKINSCASEIDNYLLQRVEILKNAAVAVNKSVNLDKDVFVDIAKNRSGNFSAEDRQQLDADLRSAERSINVVLENYPELRSHASIMDFMQQNSYLQREITATRSVYNDAIYQWNREIFVFPFNKIVAGRQGRSTRIPFIASKEDKEAARAVFLD